MLTKNGPPMPTGCQGTRAIGDQHRPRKPAIDPNRAAGRKFALLSQGSGAHEPQYPLHPILGRLLACW